MFRNAYKDIASDDFSTERANEAMALDHAIRLMKEGEEKGMKSVEAVKARHFIRRLWLYFLDDLTDPANGLPDALKAQLISIGIWVVRESDRIGEGEVKSFADLIGIMEIIRDGLK